MVFLCGCSSSNQKNDRHNQNNSIENNTLPYVITKNDQLCLSLYNAKQKKNINEVVITKKGMNIIKYKLFSIENGYAVYFEYVKKGTTKVTKNGDGNLEMNEASNIEKQISFFDKKFQITSELNLSEIFKDDDISNSSISVNKEGTQLAVSGINNGFGIYNIKEKKWLDVGHPFKDNQYCLDVAFMKNGKLFCLVNGEGEDHSFGMYDILKKTVDLKKIDYIPNPVDNPNDLLLQTNDQLYLNDNIKPRPYNSASGKVIVMSTKSLQVKMLQVNGLESSFSRITPNDNFMVSFV